MWKYRIPMNNFNYSDTISPLPPWFPIKDMVTCIFSKFWRKGQSCSTAYQNFRKLENTLFPNYIAVYTDGSVMISPPSASAGMYIPDLTLTIRWNLAPELSILAAELYAILEALTFSKKNLHSQSVIIFTDSLSSLLLISSTQPVTYNWVIYEIHYILQQFHQEKQNVKLEWIPSHAAIEGNEIADNLAKTCHEKDNLIDYPLSINERFEKENKRQGVSAMARWQTVGAPSTVLTHLGYIKDTREHSYWAKSTEREIDTAKTRLRIWHTRLKSSLNKIKIATAPYCDQCPNNVEDTSHVMMHCPQYENQRNVLMEKVSRIANKPIWDLLRSATGRCWLLSDNQEEDHQLHRKIDQKHSTPQKSIEDQWRYCYK